MSNFLNHIVAKSLGLTEAIQPRLAPRFEPLPASRGEMPARLGFETRTIFEEPPANEMTGQASTIIQTAADARPEPPPSRPRINPIAQTRPEPLEGERQITERPVVDSPNRPAPDSVQAIRPTLLVAPPQSGYPFIKQPEPSPADEPRRTPVTKRDAPASSSSSVAPQKLSSAETITHHRLNEPITSRVIPRPQTIKPEPPASASSQMPKPTSVVLRPNQSHAATTAAPAEGLNSIVATPSSPTIQITIGRVDVKAVMAQPGAPRRLPDPPSSTPSLADYLKQRNGGR